MLGKPVDPFEHRGRHAELREFPRVPEFAVIMRQSHDYFRQGRDRGHERQGMHDIRHPLPADSAGINLDAMFQKSFENIFHG